MAVPTPQHSKMLGHPASSHTVLSPCDFISDFRLRYPSPIRAFTLIHSGRSGSPGSRPSISTGTVLRRSGENVPQANSSSTSNGRPVPRAKAAIWVSVSR